MMANGSCIVRGSAAISEPSLSRSARRFRVGRRLITASVTIDSGWVCLEDVPIGAGAPGRRTRIPMIIRCSYWGRSCHNRYSSLIGEIRK